MGEKLLYMGVQKLLCGMLKSTLSFYLKLKADLERNGFMISSYDQCVAKD